ncbi:Sir2 family NAD-dependent protein deacetylase [Herbiconiux sp. KACC 21604]|uniref:Sir2 family NAD-dependent protein deacetylase n=1 Tax=unclassified Herbiconiux TaxID=2618217 RepID=UPI001492A1BF|nr:Sir2 family NAD-dependent protein deacetylase [Herbiconiux sp. SALV-R1]QJU53527.1 NAD-dependent deacetylase [Herbiconiux sp. SALV-R1]WPO88506.1 Sir2 family NAD-dependent protein deacetylase [Herbiconiux sp. KACC 21604]
MVPLVSSVPDESAEAVPTALPPEVVQAAEILAGKRIVMLTGAGVSTDSGIPDYRGEGAPVRNPMTFDQFLASESFRKRYWAGSHLGWRMFDAARPNATHLLLAELEEAGVVNGVVTQNVDGLHTRAGTRHLVDLHGSMDRVVCLRCGQFYARSDIAQRIADDNPGVTEPELVRMAPDGDAAVAEYESFVVPACTVCGGVLKPDVVFFGEFVPTEKFAEASAMVSAAEAMVIAGSSLVVNSGIRLLEQARRRRLPIVIVNRGVTKGDGRAALKIDGGVAETLTALAPLLR